jgi:H+/Cl- antiporter ClcA
MVSAIFFRDQTVLRNSRTTISQTFRTALVCGAWSASGFFSAAFLKLLRWSEEGFCQTEAADLLAAGLSGVCLGALAIEIPEVWGNGYGAITRDPARP